MPLKLIAQLDAAFVDLGDFRRELAGVPIYLDRAETSARVFREIRGKLAEVAPNLYELKGVAAGLRQAEPVVRQYSEIVKQGIKDEKFDPALGKELISIISRAVDSLREVAESRSMELSRVAGKVDGLYLAAKTAFSELTNVIAANHRAVEVEKDAEDGDWSGRGTENGQRPVGTSGGNGDLGNGAQVVPIKAKRQRSTRVKRASPEA